MEQVESVKKNTVAVFGDSNTWGYDPRSYLGTQYPKNVRWTGLLDMETNWRIVNCGQNGREIPADKIRIQSAADMLLSEIMPIKTEPLHASADMMEYNKNRAGLIWIMLGSNDLLMNDFYKAEDVTRKMEIFLTLLLGDKRISEHSETIGLMLIAPPVMKSGTWVEDERLIVESKRLGECYGRLACDLGVGFKDMSIVDIPVTFDGVHLSEKGHRIFADEIKKCLEQ